MAITPITNTPPINPDRTDRTTFSARMAAMWAWCTSFFGTSSTMATFIDEANVLQVDVNAKQISSAESASTSALKAQESAASAQASASSSNVGVWVSGTTYAAGVCVFSPITFQAYRRKVAGAGTTDPSADATNWQSVSQAVLVSGANIKTVGGITLLGSGDIALGFAGKVDICPIGTVPAGYLECNGASLSTTTYATLFAFLGYTYGGSGANFKIPDYRGQFLRGWANGSANDPDRAARTNRGDGTIGDFVGTNQVDGFESHTHSGAVDISSVNNNNTTTGSPGYWPLGGFNTGASGGNETRPININVMYIIKY